LRHEVGEFEAQTFRHDSAGEPSNWEISA